MYCVLYKWDYGLRVGKPEFMSNFTSRHLRWDDDVAWEHKTIVRECKSYCKITQRKFSLWLLGGSVITACQTKAGAGPWRVLRTKLWKLVFLWSQVADPVWAVALSGSGPAAESGYEDFNLKLSDGREAACVGCLGLSLQQQMLGGAAVGVGRYRSFTSTPETPLPSLHHCCPPLHKERYETHQQSALIHTSPVMSHFHQGLKK